MLNRYQDFDATLNDGELVVNKNYYSFLLLIGIAIAIIFILFKFSIPTNNIQSGGNLSNNTYYVVLGIILLTLVIYYRSK